ncbi:MAG: hypothetical protein K2X27_01330 [Candidatus Obscuribacterales bacterium]|nr:hypothetical protein [Candidatus Obscuribacterales bacterium]
MHDCPGCRVPLHGYEDVCPSCGTKQPVRRGSNQFSSSFRPQQPGINWMPFVITFLVTVIVIGLAMSSSWIGKLATEGPPKEDPMAKVTYTDARNIVEQELSSGLAAAGASCKFTWNDPATGDATPADKTLDKPLNLTVDTDLADGNARKPIVEKIQDYLDKGKIPTLTINDSKTRQHWTYNMSAPVAAPNSEE